MANKNFILRISAASALGGLLFGFDTAVISGAIPYISVYFHLGTGTLGWAVSSILIGCAMGAMAAGIVADKYGRKFVLMVCAVLFAISGIGVALSQTFSIFVFFRIIGGLGVGAAAMVSPMYIAEMAPAETRGRLVAFYQLAIVTGILLAYFSNYIFDGSGINNWRWMFAAQTIPAVIFLLMLLTVPETPRWLVKKKRIYEAEKIISRISEISKIKEEIFLIQKSFNEQSSFSFSQLKKYKAVLFIGILVAIFQQITGINAVLYYAPAIFKETGLNNTSSLMQTIGIGVVNLMSTFIAIGFVDKVGRKNFLVIGSILMGLSLSGVGLCFQYSYFNHYIVLVFMLIYVGAFGCTLGAVTWVYLAEIFPNAVRATALSLATLALWLADFLVAYTFPVMVGRLGIANTMFAYALVCAICFVFMTRYTKETKGKQLEEIETLFVQ